MAIPIVDEVASGLAGATHEVTGYEGLYPTHEFGIDIKGILKVFPVKGCMKTDKDGNSVIGAGGGAEISLGSLLTGGLGGNNFEIPFMYNPTTYTESKSVEYDTITAMNPDPLRLYKGGGVKTVQMELFADASWGGAASPLMGRIYGMLPPAVNVVSDTVAEVIGMTGIGRPTVSPYCKLWKALVMDREAQEDKFVYEYMETALKAIDQNRLTVPPFCILAMGSDKEMQCTVTSVNITYMMFDNMLNPLRAKINVTFEQVWMSDYGQDATEDITWNTAPYSGYGFRDEFRKNSLK